MARIYDDKQDELHVILDRAAQSAGATLVIPDLQRPYVWTPNQVSLLVDSLIRGWPFGTLLLWKVKHDEKHTIPSRAFWQVVDRTANNAGVQLQQQAPPAEYQMVLDGQQRVQSLLLATHGDNWGFKLTDKDWAVESGAKSAKGRSNATHWSVGSLCLDLLEFLKQYREANDQLSAVEFEKALVWAVNDQQKGRSKAKTSPGYKWSIPLRYSEEHASRLVRFSRLWSLAELNPGLKEKNYYEQLKKMMADHLVAPELQNDLLSPLAELMTTLRDVKLHKVSYLELSAFDTHVTTRDSYDDAIVNIFARLNTAGRTLTREEITFAWLKVGWNPEATSSRTAQECFQELREELAKQGLSLEIDELVSAVSFAWSVAFNQGALLTNRDLLKGDVIRPMAGSLSDSWKGLTQAILDVTTVVADRKLERGRHYTSVNALAVLWAATFLCIDRVGSLPTTMPERDRVEKAIDACLHEFVDRWLLCSTWAQKWARASGAILATYASQLAKAADGYRAAANIDEVIALYRNGLRSLVDDLVNDAASFVDTRLSVDAREQVNQYYAALWVWHRLDEKRWASSSKPLRLGKAKSSSTDVDHLVSVKIWESRRVSVEELLKDGESFGDIVNSVGNCVLLDKSFNISKNDKPLQDFMLEVHQIKEGNLSLDEWADNLSITSEFLDGRATPVGELVKAVEVREEAIRRDLAKFVKGDLHRIDV